MTPDDHLNAIVAEACGLHGQAGAKQRLRTDLNDAMRAYAQAKLAELPDAVTDKCFIARTKRAALQEILA